MAKGYFTQGVCLLCEQAPSLDALHAALGAFQVLGRREPGTSWSFGGPTLILAFDPDVNGYVAVDVVDRPWPDHMGDPKNDPEMIFGAWAMGNFGPFAFPGGLERAGQQSWVWEEGRSIAQRHRAFVRVRASYAFGAKDDDPIFPEDYDPRKDLDFVTRVAAALVSVPGALCYYNPNGEVLRDGQSLHESLDWAASNDLPPLDIWSNVRLFNFNQEWSMMDTVGNAQLDIADVECCFGGQGYDLQEVGHFLRNASLYLLEEGPIINDGDTMDGPGNLRWQARSFKSGHVPPPRPVLRFLPLDGRKVPREIAYGQ
jgi:hypothetical protein